MKRLTLCFAFFVVIYGGCLALLGQVARPSPPQTSWLWYIWLALGATSLSSIAVEFTFFAVWLWLKYTGFTADSGVPRRLTISDRAFLLQQHPSVAMLMPAHNEASTPQDREALAERICDVLLKTPPYCMFFLLVDSPESQRDHELSVVRDVRRRLRAAGHEDYSHRLALEEHRDKPPVWRHKCGSILRWLQRHGSQYEFMFLFDADSSLPEENPNEPRTRDVVERMVVAMLRDRNLAMVQAAMHIRDHQTPWGWVQAVNAQVGTAYYLRVFSYLYGRATPCYGHNCLLRVRDFARYARNTLRYTSHDHIDASDLAAAGRGCMISDAVLTLEEPEDSILMWLKREARWSRGNGQWIVYLCKKRGLPLAPIVFLSLGIAQYLWALVGGLFFVATAAVLSDNSGLASHVGTAPAQVLTGLVAFALFVPRCLASPSYREFFGSTAIGLILGPAIMLFQGLAFVLGAFGTRWIPRGSRTDLFSPRQMLRIASTFLPITVLGALLWYQVADNLQSGHFTLFLQIMITALIVSPLTAVLVSWPWRRYRREPADASAAVLRPE
ncbi:MAG: hypothetical protein ACM359_09000 [Bacillota bacterium]